MAQTVKKVMTAEPQGRPHDDPASHALCRHDIPRGTSPTPDPLDPTHPDPLVPPVPPVPPAPKPVDPPPPVMGRA